MKHTGNHYTGYNYAQLSICVCFSRHNNISREVTFVLQWVAKGGITADASFNYKVLPQVTTELCYKESQVRLKNCIGVYHQWTDNRLELYVWYAWRGWCGWWVSQSRNLVSATSHKPYIGLVLLIYLDWELLCVAYITVLGVAMCKSHLHLVSFLVPAL